MDIPYRAMLFGCLIEKSYHKIGFCEAKGFIHFAFRILHFAFSNRPKNCNLKFHFKNIISQFRINNRPAGMIKDTATPNFDALYGAERSFS
jgi:hypothetical protein